MVGIVIRFIKVWTNQRISLEMTERKKNKTSDPLIFSNQMVDIVDPCYYSIGQSENYFRISMKLWCFICVFETLH